MSLLRAALVLLALPAVGCGGAPRPPSTTTPASTAPAANCTTRAVTAAGVEVALGGSGRTGVALLPQSDGDACQWSRFANVLARDGIRSARVDWRGDYVPEALGAIAALRGAGARRIVLMGASLGGHVAIEAAARRPPGPDALVTLSAERTERSDPRDAARLARSIRIPSLTVGSRNDGWTTFGGVDLLAGPSGARLADRIVAFVRANA